MLHREAIIVYQACTVIVVCQTVEFSVLWLQRAHPTGPAPLDAFPMLPLAKQQVASACQILLW